MTHRLGLHLAAPLAACLLAGSAHAQMLSRHDQGGALFRVRIENVSVPDLIKAPGGKRQPTGLSPGVWEVFSGKRSGLFETGAAQFGNGLQQQAEDGDPKRLAHWLRTHTPKGDSGTFKTDAGTAAMMPAGPGGEYQFTVRAKPGMKLAVALMFGNTNDVFFSPDVKGIALFDKDGKPVSGDMTRLIKLWNAGTEVNQEPGVGPDQADEQKHPGQGTKEHEPVQALIDVKDGYTYPKVSQMLRITITPAPPK